MDDLGAHVLTSLRVRKIESSTADIERLTRWLGRLQPLCAEWSAEPDALPGDFDDALRAASHAR